MTEEIWELLTIMDRGKMTATDHDRQRKDERIWLQLAEETQELLTIMDRRKMGALATVRSGKNLATIDKESATNPFGFLLHLNSSSSRRT